MPASFLEQFTDNATVAQPGKRIAFLQINGEHLDQWTLQELHDRSVCVAAHLQQFTDIGDRVLLLFPPGLDFISAFCGCLFAGLVSVPVPIPNRKRSIQGLLSMVAASDPAVILTTKETYQTAQSWHAEFPFLHNRRWETLDETWQREAYHQWTKPVIGGGHPAMLQFTSGSTSNPKGVVISHDNLLANAIKTKHAFGLNSESTGFSWLPHYHDMGLIGMILQALYGGCSLTLSTPISFVQRPLLWLETISRLGCNVSGGPNFAYDLCVQRIRDQDCTHLDLSCWEVAFIGSEPIREATLEEFSRKFAPYGFRPEAFLPCYGLAESTLLVSGGPPKTPPRVERLNLNALSQHRVVFESNHGPGIRTVVSCGINLNGADLAVVNPETRVRSASDEVGEIWLRGQSVSSGYFRSPVEAAQTFDGQLISGEGPWLRTGDLGFLNKGELFITGRLKDVMIIRGRNIHPEDIELVLREAHASFRPGSCAVFSIDNESTERLVVIQELEPKQRAFEYEVAIRTICELIAAHFEIEVGSIDLVKAGEIPRTTSGKIQRGACREKWLAEGLNSVFHWKSSARQDETNPEKRQRMEAVSSATTTRVSIAEIEAWLLARIAKRTGIPESAIRNTTPFLELGLGSVDAMELANDLGAFTGQSLTPMMIYNHPTIAAVSKWLGAPLVEHKTPLSINPSPTFPPSSTDPILAEVQQMSELQLEEFLKAQMTQSISNPNRDEVSLPK